MTKSEGGWRPVRRVAGKLGMLAVIGAPLLLSAGTIAAGGSGETFDPKRAIGAEQNRSKHTGDLRRPLDEYVSQYADEFWDTYKPKGWFLRKGKPYGKESGERERNCRDSKTCHATGRGIEGVRNLKLDSISPGGTVIGFFRLKTKGAVEEAYELSEAAEGYFLVVYPLATPDKNKAEWKLVEVSKVKGKLNMRIIPGDGRPRYFIPCVLLSDSSGLHSMADSLKGDEAYFSTCQDKAVAHAKARAAGRPGLFMKYLEEASRERDATAETRALDLMWTSCHAGCCRAGLF